VALTITPESFTVPDSTPRHSSQRPSPQRHLSPLGPAPKVSVSATLAANEVMAGRQRRGEPVLPMAFGEAGLDVHPALCESLAKAAGCNSYGPVAGLATLREAAAGYWNRRSMPTDPSTVVCAPGSKALLFALVAAIGGDIAVTRPSWVSYAAQATLAGVRAHFVPGAAGVPDAATLARTAAEARADGRPVRAVIVTLPDNPTGTLATPSAVRALCAVAEQHDLVIISDEIYRDLIYDNEPKVENPSSFSSERTVVTTGLSKSLALGGWRIGVARLPDSALGRELRDRVLAIGSEIWSAPAGPVQQAAAFAFTEPPELTEHVARSRRLHASVARAVASRFAAAGASVPPPQAAFYVYPDFGPLADDLLDRHGITSDAGLAEVLLHRYGVGVLPASAFGERPGRLRLRVATGLLYGDSEAERAAALTATSTQAGPCALPAIATHLDHLSAALTNLLT
jgi:aspartate/methionine/tyrosine aminotransferase